MAKSKWERVGKRLFEIEMWCRNGVLEKDIAKKLGVSPSTLGKYKTEHSELKEAMESNSEIANLTVENSMYKMANGYYVKRVDAIKCKDVYWDEKGKRCEREHVEIVEYDEFIKPEYMAAATWLNNKVSDRWRRNANKEKLDKDKFEHEKKIDEKRYW